MYKKAMIALSILLLSATAQAESSYFGVSAGQTNFGTNGVSDSNSFTIAAGYRFNKNFSLEASYIDLGDAKPRGMSLGLKADGFNFSAIGVLPLSDEVDIFGKVGVLSWDGSYYAEGLIGNASYDGTDISFGFGATIDLTDQFSLVFEYQRFDILDDTSNSSIGVRFTF